MNRKVKFLVDEVVEAQGKVIQQFRAGEVYELSASSAARWIRRQVAVEVIGAPQPKKRKSAEPALESNTATVAAQPRGGDSKRTKPDAAAGGSVSGSGKDNSDK